MTKNNSDSNKGINVAPSNRPKRNAIKKPFSKTEKDTTFTSTDGNTVVTESDESFFSHDSREDDCVQVAVRIRPFLETEEKKGVCKCIETFDSEPQAIKINGSGEYNKNYTFDFVFSEKSGQNQLYQTCVYKLVKSCLDGYNATCFAYGQTGSGKTYTMLGPNLSASSSNVDETDAGIIPRATRDLFRHLSKRVSIPQSCNSHDNDANNKENEHVVSSSSSSTTESEYEVKLRFLEIYGDQIRDLLLSSSQQQIKIREVCSSSSSPNSDRSIVEESEVFGATECLVKNAEDSLQLIKEGTQRRVTGSTEMNAESSRSHIILTFIVTQHMTFGKETKTAIKSKIHFVDLAGSERQKRTKAEGQRFKEGVQINQGLLALGNVISALSSPSFSTSSNIHIPYRDSKLTRILKDALGGNSQTMMIACVSPASTNFEESLSCLRYANRAKNIKNKAIVNIDATSKLLSSLQEKNNILAMELLRIRKRCMAEEENIAKVADHQNNTQNTTRNLLLDILYGEGSKSISNDELSTMLTKEDISKVSDLALVSTLVEEGEQQHPSRIGRMARNFLVFCQNLFNRDSKLHVEQTRRLEKYQWKSVETCTDDGQFYFSLADSLEVLKIIRNELNGTITQNDTGFDKLKKLRVLHLSNNQFSGTIPSDLLTELNPVLQNVELQENNFWENMSSVCLTSSDDSNNSDGNKKDGVPGIL